MSPSLTHGSVTGLMQGVEGMQSIVQVINVKLVGNGGRYRVSSICFLLLLEKILCDSSVV